VNVDHADDFGWSIEVAGLHDEDLWLDERHGAGFRGAALLRR
jgi:hypothetical protein